jgi:hypothetical protein
MADRIIKILTPADSYDLLSLDELKTSMGIASTDTSQDAQLALWITRASDTIATYCNRVFAYEEVEETWREFVNNRIFPSHWPIAETEIMSIESPSGTILDDTSYEIEERSGKIEFFDGNSYGVSDSYPVIITYWGGYDLPDEAPPALKQACELLVRIESLMALALSRGGVRSVSHKEKRVMYYDPLQTILGKSLAPGATGLPPAVDSLLKHYMRFEV